MAEGAISLLSLAPGTYLAPIIAFEVVLAGPNGGQTTTLSSGAGTITYTASNPLTVINYVPPCALTPNLGTTENANSFYGELPPGPSTRLTQSLLRVPNFR